MGGMHAIFVFGDSVSYYNDGIIDLGYSGDDPKDWPMEDVFVHPNAFTTFSAKRQLYSAIAWASIPLVSGPGLVFNSYSDIPGEARVSVRVDKPYQTTNSPYNNGYPQYAFSTLGREPVVTTQTAETALDNIHVVPNPYYGSSQYEDSQLDNIVKIINLPNKCKVNIFMTNGTLVRSFNKDNSLSYLEWDLKNDFNVPIASGVYLIHIDAGEQGQKVVKWMGSLRPVDLNAF